MRRTSRAAYALLLGVVVGCSSSSPGAAPHASSTIPLESAMVQAITSTWVAQADPPSGVSFKLPAQATRRDRNVAGIAQRVYTDPFSDKAAVSVGIADLATASRVKPFVNEYASTLKREFETSGVKDFMVTEQRHSTYLGHQAFDMRVVYMPIGGDVIEPVWFIRLIVVGKHVVVAQTVASPPTSSATFVDTCRTVHERLVATIRFSPRTGG